MAYYERWAPGWEFQALLKARPIAGSVDLGERYAAAVAPFVWRSSKRPGFVESVQRMRERVTDNIPDAEVDRQLKLGPGGLRDVEFTMQLLQLVHGQDDETVRVRSTLEAMDALTEAGYVGRPEAARFGPDYALLRVLEHRIQLRRLQRTHLMPVDEDELRVLARSSGLATGAAALVTRWRSVKLEVRGLHERLFYRPLLSAVAASDGGIVLTSTQARDRLGAIGFVDPDGALRHIRALTQGTSRRAAIQRNLLPVLLRWMAEGPAPDRALLAFRRLSDTLGESSWFLRMLRDSSGAAHSLTTVLSESAFLSGLLERFPEAVAWLDEPDTLLVPRPIASLLSEVRATTARHGDDVAAAASLLRSVRRRETLRLGMAATLGRLDVDQLGPALSDITEATLTGALDLARRDAPDGLEFGVIAMGRYGGRELGFGSDADVLYVYRADAVPAETASRAAQGIVRELSRLTEDTIYPFDLDIDLRPEGEQRPGRPHARVLRRVLRPLVADVGGPGAAACPWRRRGRRPAARLRAPGRPDPLPGDDRGPRGARGPADQGAGGVRAAAARRGPGPAPQARTRVTERRRVVRPTAAAAVRPAGARTPDDLDPRRARRRRRRGARRARGRRATRCGVAVRLADAQCPRALVGQDHRRAAGRPDAARGCGPVDGVPARVRVRSSRRTTSA